MTIQPKKVLISGAGIVGLLTAQALKKRGIEYVIFDRDVDVNFREGAGWAITLYWALDTFMSLLPPEIAEDVYDAQVRQDFHRHDTGKFKVIDASNGESILSIPPSNSRLRVRREQIRRILLKGIDVQWNCKLTEISETSDSITVKCSSGREFKGDVLLGCDGSNSATRKIICGENGVLNQLPFRFCGAKVKMTGKEIEGISSRFDPLLFMGNIPSNETFFWFSMLAAPDYTKQEDLYYAQVNLSWKVDDKEEPFDTNEDKAAAMLKRANGLHPDLYALVIRTIQDPRQLVEVKLADWPQVQWDTMNHKVLLLGDAAHAMTMYRGEAANQGITDVAELMQQLDLYQADKIPWSELVANYCYRVKNRTSEAVLRSRKACIDAHDRTKMRADSDSPLLWMRRKFVDM